ncbi:MAG: lysophospholipase [Alphaproteobacteria bacterium]|nr:lysophospholipase [Alphaproteobacteria bacterium]
MTDHWTAAWSASAQGPFPHGRETAQPDLSTIFPEPGFGARDQSFRMIVRPDVWGSQARIRLSNAHGSKPVTFDNIHIGMQAMSSAILTGTNRQITFDGADNVTIEAGASATSDAVDLDFITDPNDPLLTGKALAVSFRVAGDSGPMTYHAKASQTSYLSEPGAEDVCASEEETAFPYSTTSWFFFDALDMNMVAPTKVIVAFGDSISDGSGSTINGFDRWPDVVARRLHAKFGNSVSLVNQGIGGNQVLGPPDDTPPADSLGGISALKRLERDVVSMAGVSTVIWLEGINDFGFTDVSAEEVIKGVQQGVAQMRKAIPGVRIIGATLTTALNATTGGHGKESVDSRRRTFNEFVRTTDIYDGIIDFDAATYDDATGELRLEMVPNSCIGGPGDKLHPNRVGYQAMAAAVDIDMLIGE